MCVTIRFISYAHMHLIIIYYPQLLLTVTPFRAGQQTHHRLLHYYYLNHRPGSTATSESVRV